MEHFPIVQAICRLALVSPNEALTHQIDRLAHALSESGDVKSAQQLKHLVKSAARNQDMTPRRLVPSRASTASLPGEALLDSTILPSDRESGARLVDAVFPNGDSVAAPFLPASLERAIRTLIDEWRHMDALRAVGEHPSLSCLLTGAPGTGKTTLALWMAQQIGLPVLVARVDAMMSSFLGTTSRNIAQVFDFANRFRCVLLLDELDSLAKIRDDVNEVGEIKRVVNALLQNMDSRAGNGITLGITNHPQLLDPAVWRRFMSQIEVPLPTQEIRESIVRRTFKPLDEPPAVAHLIAALMEGSAGSEVKTIVSLFKKRQAMTSDEISPVETIREIVALNSGRLSSEVKTLLKRDDQDLARWIRSKLGSDIGVVELGTLFKRGKSTVGRWVKEAERKEA